MSTSLSNTTNSSKMFQLNTILLASAIFAFCESAAIVGKINKKCSITDDGCMQALYTDFLKEIADNGIPEFEVPKMDPMTIKNMELDALGMIKVTVKEGEAHGFKSCKVTGYKNDLANQRNTLEFVCDVFDITGTYKVESTPTLLALIGGINIHGEGNAKAAVEQVHLSFDLAYEIKKLDDGELHFLLRPEDSTFDFEVKGKTTVQLDNILIGKQEISAILVNIFNENSEFLVNSFGKVAIDQLLHLFYQNVQKFFTGIPAKELLTDDLSPYVKS